jgi:hypothetical protein
MGQVSHNQQVPTTIYGDHCSPFAHSSLSEREEVRKKRKRGGKKERKERKRKEERNERKRKMK